MEIRMEGPFWLWHAKSLLTTSGLGSFVWFMRWRQAASAWGIDDLDHLLEQRFIRDLYIHVPPFFYFLI